MLFYLFGLLSTSWSDDPYVALKRLIKCVGALSMALIILTEAFPFAALGVIMKRLAFLLLPLSVLFIKYYPDLGRAYSAIGSSQVTGATFQKNSLGELCMLLGIYFFWHLLFVTRKRADLGPRLHPFLYWVLLLLLGWLLYMADSATSLACLVVAICVILIGRLPKMIKNPTRIMTLCFTCSVLYLLLQLAFDINNIFITMLGRRPDLTTRVPMWHDLLTMAVNPYLGSGWQSFGMGQRLLLMYARWRVVSTHNGYLDMYLNLGIIGLVLQFGWVFFGLQEIRRNLYTDYHTALLKFCFIIVVMLFNWTETVVFGVSNVYLIFLLGTLNVTWRPRDASYKIYRGDQCLR